MDLTPAFSDPRRQKFRCLISADEVEISSRLPYKSRAGLVVVTGGNEDGIHRSGDDGKSISLVNREDIYMPSRLRNENGIL